MTRTVLILGATGRFGHAAAAAFARDGWRVRAFDRRTGDLARAADGAQVIVNGWNPPYHRWAEEVPGLHAAVRRAALGVGARVLLPGNVYVFGPGVPSPWGAASPHRASNPLGQIRIAIEAAYADAGVRTLVLRAGDFLDTRASGNWFDRILARHLRKGRLVYPGDPDAEHAWAFLPDLAAAAVALAGQDDALPAFADVPFPGLTLSGRGMAALLARVTGHPVGLRRFPWWQVALARPVWPDARHLIEMRYLWDLPHRLDGGAFARLCPGFVPTPAEAALRAAIAPL